MKTQDETSSQGEFRFIWFLGIFFAFLLSWIPRYGLTQVNSGGTGWTANLGNPVITLAVLNDRIQIIESRENEIYRNKIGFFRTTSVGHNYSRVYMLRFLELLESYSNELQVVEDFKGERFATFRASLGQAVFESEFRSQFMFFLDLLKEVRIGIFDQLGGTQKLNQAQIERLTNSSDPMQIAEIVSIMQEKKSPGSAKVLFCKNLL